MQGTGSGQTHRTAGADTDRQVNEPIVSKPPQAAPWEVATLVTMLPDVILVKVGATSSFAIRLVTGPDRLVTTTL